MDVNSLATNFDAFNCGLKSSKTDQPNFIDVESKISDHQNTLNILEAMAKTYDSWK